MSQFEAIPDTQLATVEGGTLATAYDRGLAEGHEGYTLGSLKGFVAGSKYGTPGGAIGAAVGGVYGAVRGFVRGFAADTYDNIPG